MRWGILCLFYNIFKTIFMKQKKILLLISVLVSSLLFAQKTSNKKIVKEFMQKQFAIKIYVSAGNTFSYSIFLGKDTIISDEKRYGRDCSCNFKTEFDAEEKAKLVCKDISEKGVMPSSVGNKAN